MSDNKRLGVEFNDEVHTADGVEAQIAEKSSTAGAQAVNVAANAIPKFVMGDGVSSLQAAGHHLEAARRAIKAAESGPHLTSSPATSTPVLGKLWGRIRGQMHELVLFYVNRSGATQQRVNDQLIEAVESLSQIVETQQTEIESLKQRLKDDLK